MKVLQILSLIIGLSFAVYSQNTTGKAIETILSGTVYDDNGAVITNAVIKAVGSDKKEIVAKTTDSGIFEIKLFPGNYLIQAESPVFQIFKLENYRIAPSYKGKMNLDIVLAAGEVEPCGYGGAGIGCMTAEPIITDNSETKISDKIIQKPLEKPSTKQNKKKKN